MRSAARGPRRGCGARCPGGLQTPTKQQLDKITTPALPPTNPSRPSAYFSRGRGGGSGGTPLVGVWWCANAGSPDQPRLNGLPRLCKVCARWDGGLGWGLGEVRGGPRTETPSAGERRPDAQRVASKMPIGGFSLFTSNFGVHSFTYFGITQVLRSLGLISY